MRSIMRIIREVLGFITGVKGLKSFLKAGKLFQVNMKK